MSVERTRETIDRYLNSGHQDLSMMSDDVVFTNMTTGEEHHGVEGVRRMLDYIYHTAFDAVAETRSRVYAENQAVLEGEFVGTHIGTFAGIDATRRKVRVPLCVLYDLDDGKIKRGRVYMQVPVLLKQLGGGAAEREVAKR
jgi:predicted ester cyclase